VKNIPLRALFKKHREGLVIVFICLLTWSLIRKGIERQKESMGLNEDLIEVLIASETFEKGQRLNPNALTIHMMPQRYAPISALYPSDMGKFEGQLFAKTVYKGDILLTSALDVHFALSNASTKITEGYRALSIPVDELSSLSYTIEPGDHIDLLTTLDMNDRQPTTMTLLQNISVLSTGQDMDGAYSAITLMVLPSEAPLIIHAMQQHTLSVILRNPYDQKTRQDLPMIAQSELIKAGFLNHLQQARDNKITILHQTEAFD